MLQKFKNKLLAISSLLVLAVPAIAPAAVLAADPSIQAGVCQGAEHLQVNPVTGDTCVVTGGDEDSFNTLLTKIINVISLLVGVVAVIMIIFGGFKYITSGGDTTKVTGAKNTILYGLVGLVIVALAQVLVRFVLKQVTDTA
jgi:Type IV secretion system pilin